MPRALEASRRDHMLASVKSRRSRGPSHHCSLQLQRSLFWRRLRKGSASQPAWLQALKAVTPQGSLHTSCLSLEVMHPECRRLCHLPSLVALTRWEKGTFILLAHTSPLSGC